MTDPHPTLPPDAPPVCPRHPGLVSYVRCQRCQRPVCPACQREAPVGVQCVDCVAEGAKSVRQGRTMFGGQVTDGRPRLTLGIMGFTAGVFALQMLAWGATTGRLAFVPHLGDIQPWRFLTSALVHGNFLHIAINMYALFIIGTILEPTLGRARFLALYLLGSVGGSVAILLLASPTSNEWFRPTVGASGAVFALFGALFVLQRRLGRSSNGLLILIGINFIFPFFYPNISWQGHLGGLVTGLLVGAVFAYLGRPAELGRPGDFSRHWLGLAAVAALLVLLAVAKYALV